MMKEIIEQELNKLLDFIEGPNPHKAAAKLSHEVSVTSDPLVEAINSLSPKKLKVISKLYSTENERHALYTAFYLGLQVGRAEAGVKQLEEMMGMKE